MYQQQGSTQTKVGGSTLQSTDAAVGKSTLAESEAPSAGVPQDGPEVAGKGTLAEGSGAFSASFLRAEDDPADLAPDPPARNLEANKAEIATFAKSQPQDGGVDQTAKPEAPAAGGGEAAPVSPELAKSIEAAQADTKAAVDNSNTEATTFKTTMKSEQDRFDAEQNATTLEQLKTMTSADKRATLKDLGYDAKEVQKLKDAELDAIIEGKLAAQNRKNKILGMDADERAKLSPEQKKQFLADLGIDKGDLDQAGPGRCAQCFDDVMRVASIPGQHKVKIQIRSGFFSGKSWEITVKTDADGGTQFDVEKKGGFFSKLWGWVKAALPIILMVLAPLTAGVSLIVLAVYQTVTAIMNGDWLGAVLGVVGAISGVSAFMAVKGLSTASSMITKIAETASKVGKVAQAAKAAMDAAKAKNAGSLLGALAAGAAGFATFATNTANAFATKMNEWAAKLKQWSVIVQGGEKVVTGIQKGDPLAAMNGAFDTVAGVVGARGGTEPKALQTAANITRFASTSKAALGKNPADYGAVAAAALGIAGELKNDQKLEDAAKIVGAANKLKLAWDNREANPGALADAAFAVAEAIQTAKYDATAKKDENGKPIVSDDQNAVTKRYESARKIVSSAAQILTAATAKPRPNYMAALSAVTAIVAELNSDKRVDQAAAIMQKLDAWTAAVAMKDEAAIFAAGRALGETINGMRTELTKERDDAKQAAAAKLAPGEQLADDGTELPPLAPLETLPGEQLPLPSTPTVDTDGQLAAPPDPAPLPRLQLGGNGKASTPNGNYTVFRGDSLSGIASRFDVTVANLLDLNPQLVDNKIYEGQKLFVPGADVKLKPNVTVDTTYQVDPQVVADQRALAVRSAQSMVNTMNAQIRDWRRTNGLGADFGVKVDAFSKLVDDLDNYIDRPTATAESINSFAKQVGDEFNAMLRLFDQRIGQNNFVISGGIVAATIVRDGAGALISALDRSRLLSGAYQGIITAIDEYSKGGNATSITARSALAAAIEAFPDGKGLFGNMVNEAMRELANTGNEYFAEVAREPDMSPEKKRELQLKYAVKIPTLALMGAVKGKLDFEGEEEKISKAEDAMNEMLFKLFKVIADKAFEGKEGEKKGGE